MVETFPEAPPATLNAETQQPAPDLAAQFAERMRGLERIAPSGFAPGIDRVVDLATRASGFIKESADERTGAAINNKYAVSLGYRPDIHNASDRAEHSTNQSRDQAGAQKMTKASLAQEYGLRGSNTEFDTRTRVDPSDKEAFVEARVTGLFEELQGKAAELEYVIGLPAADTFRRFLLQKAIAKAPEELYLTPEGKNSHITRILIEIEQAIERHSQNEPDHRSDVKDRSPGLDPKNESRTSDTETDFSSLIAQLNAAQFRRGRTRNYSRRPRGNPKPHKSHAKADAAFSKKRATTETKSPLYDAVKKEVDQVAQTKGYKGAIVDLIKKNHPDQNGGGDSTTAEKSVVLTDLLTKYNDKQGDSSKG